ncbi:LOW QUALITY PROTEIN: hypothetical protein ACHAXR_003504 [Thalassiosira sp. AJA248-18]
MSKMCNEDVHHVLILDTMVDRRETDVAIALQDQRFICNKWKYGSTSWGKGSELKECYPVQTAKYEVSQGLNHGPGFNYLVPQTLKKRNRIIALLEKCQTRYLKKTMNFGIEVPKTVIEALALDEKNGNTIWTDAISKEVKNVKVPFNILPDDEDFRRKARLVAGGDDPKVKTYSSVVSQNTVRRALTLAALNNLEVKEGDIMNAYVTAPVTEKIWTVLGPEWGDQKGKKAIVIHALCGLKSSGAAFRAHSADCMRHLDIDIPCADPTCLWLESIIDLSEAEYYSYILCYIDNASVVHHNAMSVLNKVNKYLKMKPSSKGDPGMNLGVELK